MPTITMRAVPPFVAGLQHEQCDWRVQAAAEAPPGALRAALLNLMPTKAVTERQWLRLVAQANVKRPIHIDLVRLDNWTPRHTSAYHMAEYYRPLSELTEGTCLLSDFDAVIVTGAPLGHMRYADVRYWLQVVGLFDRLQSAAVPTLLSCWAAQAALYHLFNIATLRRPDKLSGVFKQHVAPLTSAALMSAAATSTTRASAERAASSAPVDAKPFRHAQLTLGLHQAVQELPKPLIMPQSRFALPDPRSLDALLQAADQPLRPLLMNHQNEPTVLVDEALGNLLLLGHPEYEHDTLSLEYQRDRAKAPHSPAPCNYNSEDQAASTAWQAVGAVLLGTWLNHAAPR